MGLKNNPTAATNFFHYEGLNVNADSVDKFLPVPNFNNDSKDKGKNQANLRQSFPKGPQNSLLQFPVTLK